MNAKRNSAVKGEEKFKQLDLAARTARECAQDPKTKESELERVVLNESIYETKV